MLNAMKLRPLRILVASSVHPSNDARIVKQTEALSRAGHDCTLLAPWAGAERRCPFRAEYFQRHSGLGGRILAQLKFLRAALFHRWDVIHFHDFDLVPAAVLVRLLTGQRIIYDVHENYGEEVMSRGYIPGPMRAPVRTLVNAVEWLGVRIIGRLVVVVPVQVERFTRWGCRKIVLVRNFASNSFLPAAAVEHSADQTGRFVINTGGQSLNTGTYLLLDAAIWLHNKGYSIPIRAIDRFEAAPGLRDGVLAKAKEAAPSYQFLPRVLPQEVGSYLSQSLIGLSLRPDIPSQRMGIPTKIFEYMAYGIPIIATDVGYQAEIVRASGAGILVPPNDPVALAQAIVRLWQDSALRNDLAKRGREAFVAKYSWENEAKKLVQFYAEV